jgi:hypothetical protein
VSSFHFNLVRISPLVAIPVTRDFFYNLVSVHIKQGWWKGTTCPSHSLTTLKSHRLGCQCTTLNWCFRRFWKIVLCHLLPCSHTVLHRNLNIMILNGVRGSFPGPVRSHLVDFELVSPDYGPLMCSRRGLQALLAIARKQLRVFCLWEKYDDLVVAVPSGCFSVQICLRQFVEVLPDLECWFHFFRGH